MKIKSEIRAAKQEALRENYGANWKNVCFIDFFDTPDVPDPNPGMLANAAATTEVAKIQQQTATDYLNFAKQQYDDNKGFLADIAQAQADILKSNQARADDYANYEKETFRPLERQLIDQAKNYNTEAKREELASQAAADVNAAYSNVRDQSSRQLERFGINPNSGRFAAINASLGLSQAADQAGAMTRSRIQSEQLGYARMQDAVGLGRGLAPNASTAYGIAINAGNSAAGNSMAGANYMGSAYGQTGNMLGQAGNTYGTAGNIYAQDFNARMQGYNSQLQSQSAMGSALGSIAGVGLGLSMPGFAGMMGGGSFGSGMQNYYTRRADGGEIEEEKEEQKGLRVRGPGGPVDDKIPAMLSNGEYVLPADTAKKLGIKFLDEVVEKTHVPAAKQRKQMARKAGLRRKI